MKKHPKLKLLLEYCVKNLPDNLMEELLLCNEKTIKETSAKQQELLYERLMRLAKEKIPLMIKGYLPTCQLDETLRSHFMELETVFITILLERIHPEIYKKCCMFVNR